MAYYYNRGLIEFTLALTTTLRSFVDALSNAASQFNFCQLVRDIFLFGYVKNFKQLDVKYKDFPRDLGTFDVFTFFSSCRLSISLRKPA
jgi:hypothetical protein